MKLQACSVLMLPLSLTAQNFVSSAVTTTPLTATCSIPGLTTLVETVPANSPLGPIAFQQVLTSVGPNLAQCQVDGQFAALESEIRFAIVEFAAALGTGSVTIAPHDCVLVMQAAVPTPVTLRIDWIASQGAGAALPLAQVDIGDDGTIEFQGATTGQTMTVPLLIGSTPFRIRTHTAISVAPGISNSSLHCKVFPAFGITSSTSPSPGCSGAVQVATTFEHELLLGLTPLAPAAGVQLMVIGFTQLPAPVTLPFSACNLLASPDVILLPTLGQVRVNLLPLPAGPHTLFVQGYDLLFATGQMTGTALEQVLLP